MARLSLSGRFPKRTAFLAVCTLSAAVVPWPVNAGRALDDGCVVVLEERNPLDGRANAKSFTCRAAGSCVSKVRVEIGGRPHEYFVFAALSEAKVSMNLGGIDKETPDLNHGHGNPLVIAPAPDGTGSRDATVTALRDGGYRYPGFSPPEPTRVPVANVRVTIRRESAARQNR
jgi:hypothetical protein